MARRRTAVFTRQIFTLEARSILFERSGLYISLCYNLSFVKKFET